MCFKGNALDCIIPPTGGRGGLYLGNRDAATNPELLNSLRIRAVLTLDDLFDYTYFNCKVKQEIIIDHCAQSIQSEGHSRGRPWTHLNTSHGVLTTSAFKDKRFGTLLRRSVQKCISCIGLPCSLPFLHSSKGLRCGQDKKARNQA